MYIEDAVSICGVVSFWVDSESFLFSCGNVDGQNYRNDIFDALVDIL